MTPQQTATVKAYILATPALAAMTSGVNTNYGGISDTLSAEVSPSFIVWRNSVTRDEIQNDDAFNWTQVDNLSTGSKYRIWEWMFQNGPINPSKPNIRAGIAATWVGNAQLLAVQAVVLAKCKRNANVVEKVLATGTGSDAVPATMGYEGGVSLNEVADMFRV
jgi:hypothetical protein